MRITYECIECGVVVTKERTPGNLRGGLPKFCSRACIGRHRKGSGSGPTPNHHFECVQCGRSCSVYRSPTAPVEPRFCSLACIGASQRGDQNPAYHTGRHIDAQGYIRVRVDGRYELEHRVVMAEHIGRPLLAKEVVHHRNCVRTDNRIENLQLVSGQGEHMAIHRELRRLQNV